LGRRRRLPYRPTTYRYKGRTRTIYIVYSKVHPYRGGVERRREYVKRVYVSGRLMGYEIGTFTNRRGRRVYGVRIAYENPVRTRYGTRAVATVTKIVELPRDAENIRVTDNPPRGALMDIT